MATETIRPIDDGGVSWIPTPASASTAHHTTVNDVVPNDDTHIEGRLTGDQESLKLGPVTLKNPESLDLTIRGLRVDGQDATVWVSLTDGDNGEATEAQVLTLTNDVPEDFEFSFPDGPGGRKWSYGNMKDVHLLLVKASGHFPRVTNVLGVVAGK